MDILARKKLARELSSTTKSTSPIAIKVRNDDKVMVNRYCLVHPKQKDFGQLTKLENVETDDITVSYTDQYTNILSEQYGFIPVQAKISETKVKHVLCGHEFKVENSSQHDARSFIGPKFVKTTDGTRWQNIDHIDDVDEYIQATIHTDSATPTKYRSKPISIHISEIPRVKIIVEKFSKFKRHNVELRRLDEKVVCIEYDIYDFSSTSTMNEPIQTMRAFFSVKPAYDNCECEALPVTELPENIKDKFKILDEDLKKLTVKEIEIIDDSIENNKSYLDDLRRILKRQHHANKGKSSLDLKTLYEMARRETELACSDFKNGNFFSNSELLELKNLIIQSCTSSVHGISRRRIRNGNERKLGEGVLSGSIVSELMR